MISLLLTKNNIIMCGILCAFELKQSSESIRPQILEMSKKLRIEVLIGVVFTQRTRP